MGFIAEIEIQLEKKNCLHWFPPSISCLIKQKEKMLQHRQRHINQAWKHNGENLTEGNPRQRQTHEILLAFIVPPSVFSTQLVCWPISGVDPKTTIKNHCLILSALPPSSYLSIYLREFTSCIPEVIIAQHSILNSAYSWTLAISVCTVQISSSLGRL